MFPVNLSVRSFPVKVARPPCSFVIGSPTGLSSVKNFVSSAGQDKHSFLFALNIMPYPFDFISNLFTNAYKWIAQRMTALFNFFIGSRPNPETLLFIQEHLDHLTGEVFQEAMDRFSHLSTPQEKLRAFSIIQKAPQVSVATTRAFYDLLPVDTQNHLHRHIWIQNGRRDLGDMTFGRTMIDTNIKAELVRQGIEDCLKDK